MNKIVVAAGFFLLCLSPAVAYAQTLEPPINSGEILQSGYQYSNEKKYDDAIREFARIDENDTNYLSASLELANACMLAGRDSEAVIHADRMLKEPSRYEQSFYLVKGSCQNSMGRFDDAMKTFQQGLAKFPKSYLLYYNIGVAYLQKKDYAAAEKNFMQALAINPDHSSSHLKLGLAVFHQGKLVPSVLSMMLFLQLENKTQRSLEVVVLMEKILKGEEEPKGTLTVGGDTDDFTELEAILKSKVALNGKYKSKIDLQYDLVKQLQLLLEKLTYNAGDKGYWMQTYVPYFTSLQKEDFFEDYMYYVLAAVENEAVSSWHKKHSSSQEKFQKWAYEKLGNSLFTFEEEMNGSRQKLRHYYYASFRPEAIGNIKNNKTVGYWKFFYKSGMPKSEGSFDDKGNREGHWKFYYESGPLREEAFYTAGNLSGFYRSFHENGARDVVANYSNNLYEGTVETFYPNNVKRATYQFKAGKKTGGEVTYHNNGAKKYEVNLLDGEPEGPCKYYHRDGKVSDTCAFVAGKRAGSFVTYYEDGTKKFEGTYKNDLAVGAYKSYHRNGKLKEEGFYNDKGAFTGNWKLYSPEGVISEEWQYSERGKIISHKYYSYRGKLENELIFKSEELAQSVSYNDKGEVINDQKKKGDRFQVTFYQANGNKLSEGVYLDGLRDGEWKYYDVDGYLSSTENYSKGNLEGKYTSYHPSGKIKTEYSYQNDQLEGIYKAYYLNGTLERQGYYAGGEEQGYWYYYHEDGARAETRYYLNGEQNGKQVTFDVTGKKYKEDIIRNGFLVQLTYFDTLGNATDVNKLPFGEGSLQFSFPNKKTRMNGQYKYGKGNGAYTWYHSNGKVQSQFTYVDGKKTGTASYFYEDGTKRKEENYVNGELHGAYVSYYENGAVHEQNTYVNGEQDGLQKSYYDSKNVFRFGPYRNGKGEGSFAYYSEDGQLIMRRYYENDVLLGYSYIKNGKYDSIPVRNETGHILAFYPTGQKSAEYDMAVGYVNGKRVEYYTSGKLRKDENYYFGKLEGAQKYYYPGGTLKKEENYLLDQLHGPMKTYHENGKLKTTGQYVNGSKHGEWKYYDNTGRLTSTRLYFDDQLIQ
jgi:uncharacterized protein